MLGRIIFFLTTSAAILAVLLLALISPIPQKRAHSKNSYSPWQLCFHHPLRPPNPQKRTFATRHENGAIIFRYKLTEGLKNTSREIGEAQGFFVPTERAEFDSFSTVHLNFNVPEHAGSLCIEAGPPEHGTRREVLAIVGGTGAFTFARGGAVLTQSRCALSEANPAFCMEIKMIISRNLF